jgi:hypothetical protein
MLCHHWLVGPLSGRCFAAESVLAHFLADALPPWSLGLRWRMLCRRCCWMLVLWVDGLPPRICLVRRRPLRCCIVFSAGSIGRSSWRRLSLYFFFFLLLCLFQVTNHYLCGLSSVLRELSRIYVVQLLCLMKNGLYSLVVKKKGSENACACSGR